MKVIVTGAAGFIGQRLVGELLARPGIESGGERREITSVIATDLAEPAAPISGDPRLEFRPGDIADPGFLASILPSDAGLVFHLAAVVSGGAEADFDLGWKVNLDASRSLLEILRGHGTRPRLVFASSVAVFGGDLPPVIEDTTPLNPQTSYGAQKAMVEFLVNDYSRKGYLDGRALRLPTIVIRPGKPNLAASSFASSIMREPLMGRTYACPVKPDTPVWVLSPRQVVASFLHAAELPPEAWGFQRAVALPGIGVRLDEMVATLKEAAGSAVAARISWVPDPPIEKIVYGWPTRFAPARALAMGFRPDERFRDIVDAFIEEEWNGSPA